MVKLKTIKDIIVFAVHISETIVTVRNFTSLTSYFQKNF